MGRSRRYDIQIRTDWHKTEKGCWSLSLGRRGCRVRVTQREPGGVFIRETWVEGTGRTQASLGTTSRVEARDLAEQFYTALVRGELPAASVKLTLGELWDRYTQDNPAYRSVTQKSREAQNASAGLLLEALGRNTAVEDLTLFDVELFTERRRKGTLRPSGRKIRAVGARTVAADLQTLRAMVRWGCRVRGMNGAWLVKDNPLRGMKLPREENPKRPVATYDRFQRVQEAIRALTETAPQRRGKVRWTRLELALVLVEATGARIGAIRGLRWSDITYSPDRISWRAEFDKRGRDRTVPIPSELAATLRAFQIRLEGFGDGWLFPNAVGDAPWPREVFGELLRKAEVKADVEHLRGGLWHPYRRKWATERKDMPLVDVAAAGGWKDHKTLLTCYQHTDESSMLHVMSQPRKLLSVAAGAGK